MSLVHDKKVFDSFNQALFTCGVFNLKFSMSQKYYDLFEFSIIIVITAQDCQILILSLNNFQIYYYRKQKALFSPGLLVTYALFSLANKFMFNKCTNNLSEEETALFFQSKKQRSFQIVYLGGLRYCHEISRKIDEICEKYIQISGKKEQKRFKIVQRNSIERKEKKKSQLSEQVELIK
ncbi:hypothetical protein ABPG74_014947 [Tetrahymena malaccensis]